MDRRPDDALELTPARLRTFLAVATYRSFTRAAHELQLTQPAISRQISQLEEALGLPLFELVGRAVHLTEAGSAFLLHARRILGDVERALELAAQSREGHGLLRIGASSTPGLYLLPPVIGRFHRAFPDVQIGYTVANTLEIEELIIRNELDLGFVGAHLASTDLELEAFAEDEIVCFAHPDHRLARRKRIPPAELGKETIVAGQEGSATRRLFEGWLLTAGAGTPHILQLRTPEAVKMLVAGGLGVGVLSRFGVADLLASRRIVALDIAAPPLRRALSTVRHPEKAVTPAMRAFLDLVREELAGRDQPEPKARR
jgi:LysR family transcriptional regulator, low CO2-responsive transcriptional regulator